MRIDSPKISNLTTNGFIKTISGDGTLQVDSTVTTGYYLRGNGTTVAMSALGASDLVGTIPSAVLGVSTVYIGNTGIALNRGSGALALTGITSIDGTSVALATPRNIYGNAFDGTAALTQIIASTYGGTGNGFTKFTGPLTTEKTFTLPNSSATILTDFTAVTVLQGGTGATTAAGARTNLGLVIGTDVLAYRTFGTAASNNTGDFYATGSTVANSTTWNGASYTYLATGTVNSYILGLSSGGDWRPMTTAAIQSWLGLGSAAYINSASFTKAGAYNSVDLNTSWQSGVYSGFNNPNAPITGDIGVMIMPTWSGNDGSTGGRYTLQLVTGLTGDIYSRHTSASGTGTWYKFWDSRNFDPTTYLPLSGGTLTGSLSGTTITMSGAINTSGAITGASYTTTGTTNIQIAADGGGIYQEFSGTTTGNRVMRLQGSNGASSYTQLYLDAGNQSIYAKISGVQYFGISTSGISSTAGSFSGDVFANYFKPSTGYMFYFGGANRGGIYAHSSWFGGAANYSTVIAAETGYGLELLVNGGTTQGLTIATTGVATFNSSVYGVNYISTVAPTNTNNIGTVPNYPNYNFVGYGGYWGFRTGTSFDVNLDTYNGSSYINALKVTQAGLATFNNTVVAKTFIAGTGGTAINGCIVATGNQAYQVEMAADPSGGYIQTYDRVNTKFQPFLLYAGSNTPGYQTATFNSSGFTTTGTLTSGWGALFAGGSYDTYIDVNNANTLNFGYNANTSMGGWINYRGYHGGNTQYRDFNIGNGMQVAIFSITGSTGAGIYTGAGGLRIQQAGAYTGGTYNFQSGIANGGTITGVPAVARFDNNGSGYITKIIMSDSSISDCFITYEPNVTGANAVFGIGTNSNYKQFMIYGDGHTVNTSFSQINTTGTTQIVLNSSGANYAMIQNDSTGVWSLGWGPTPTTLGTKVFSWTSGGDAYFYGGVAMTGGWNRNVTLTASFPGIVFASNATKWASFNYDYSSTFIMRVGATSIDTFGSGYTVFQVGQTGLTTFSYNLTAPGFLNSSDIRLKNILSRDGDLVEFTWKKNSDMTVRTGYIAQEVQLLYPNQVSEDESGFLSVNYTEVHTIKIRRLEKEVEELRNELEQLKSNK